MDRKFLTTGLLALVFVYGFYNSVLSFTGWLQGYDFAQIYIASRLVLVGESDKTLLTGEEWAEECTRFGLEPFRYRDGTYAENVPSNVYPPFAAIAAVPLALLPFGAARRIFYIMNLASILVAVILLFANREPERKKQSILLACCAIAIFNPFYFGQYMGQVNPILLLLCVLGLYLGRKNSQVLAGTCIGLAAAIKLFPIMLALFFLVKRQYRAAIAGAASFVLFSLVSLTAFTPTFAVNYYAKFLPGAMNDTCRWVNQGMPAFFAKLFVDNYYTQPLLHSPTLAYVLTAVFAVAIVLAISAFSVKRCKPDSRLYETQFAAFLVAAVIILPKSWTYMPVFFLPAYFLMAEWMLDQKTCYTRSWFLLIASFVTWAFTFPSYEYQNIPHTLLGTFFLSLNFYASVVLLVLLLWRLRPRRCNEYYPHECVSDSPQVFNENSGRRRDS